MERRKFLIGAGSAAVGSSALIGSGAFNFANVERNVSVEVADDSNAFLALNDTSKYADGSGDALEITFDESATTPGSGINEDSDYSFTGVFSIKNQGSQSVGVWIEEDESTDAAEWHCTSSDDTPEFTSSIEGSGNAYALDVGDEVYVNVVLLTRDDDVDVDDLPEAINVVADASAGN